MLQRYLVSSVVLWGSVGAIHGTIMYKLNTYDNKTHVRDPALRYIGGGILYGVFLGPWAPIAGPVWLAKKWPSSSCTYLKY
jgi:hypothetical protein